MNQLTCVISYFLTTFDVTDSVWTFLRTKRPRSTGPCMPDASSVEMAKDVWAQREFWSVRILGCVTEQTFWIFGCLCSTCVSWCVSLSCSKMLPRRHGQGREMGVEDFGSNGASSCFHLGTVPRNLSTTLCLVAPVNFLNGIFLHLRY